MKKTWILLALTIPCLGLFSACSSSADTMPSPSPMVSESPETSPSVSPSTSPEASPSTDPSVSISPTEPDVTMSIDEAEALSEKIRTEVEKLSEVSTVTAVVAGNIALVGLEYDAQYQEGLTSRITEMVTERIETVDKTITSVQVTDDSAIIEELDALCEKMKSKDITYDQLQTEVLDIGSRINGGSGTTGSTPESSTTDGMDPTAEPAG